MWTSRKNLFGLCLIGSLALLSGCTHIIPGQAKEAAGAPKLAVKLSAPINEVDTCTALSKVPSIADANSIRAPKPSALQKLNGCSVNLTLDGKRVELSLEVDPERPTDTKRQPTNIGGYLGWRDNEENSVLPTCKATVPLADGGFTRVSMSSSDKISCDKIDKFVSETFAQLEKETPKFPEDAKLLRLKACDVLSNDKVGQAFGQNVTKQTPANAGHECSWVLSAGTTTSLRFSYGKEIAAAPAGLFPITIENIAGKQASVLFMESLCSVDWVQRTGPKGTELAEITVVASKNPDPRPLCRKLAESTMASLPKE